MIERNFGWDQLSLIDETHPWLDREFCYVGADASEIAAGLGWLPEQSFDDFDYFRIVIAERAGKKIAFLSRPRKPETGSSVFATGGATIEDLYELLDACGELRDGRVMDTSGVILRS